MRFHLRALSFGIIAAQAACSAGPTTPTGHGVAAQSNQRLNQLWSEGQKALAELSQQWAKEGKSAVGGDVLSVPASRFHFVAHRERLELSGEPIGGYFDADSLTIHYQEALMDGAIQHEAGHAILFVLNDPRWRCVFHGNCA